MFDKKETPVLAAFAGEFSTLNYRLQCASDMAFCLSVAFAGNDVDGAQAGNALWALSDYLTHLYDKQEALLDTAYTHTLESDEQTDEEEGGATQ
ncbi:MAG: hypothetical protein LUG44_02580 [Clostridiales bacterium]|nr:hypothetical protein [Clostridiales bacterium]